MREVEGFCACRGFVRSFSFFFFFFLFLVCTVLDDRIGCIRYRRIDVQGFEVRGEGCSHARNVEIARRGVRWGGKVAGAPLRYSRKVCRLYFVQQDGLCTRMGR